MDYARVIKFSKDHYGIVLSIVYFLGILISIIILGIWIPIYHY